MDLEQNKIKTIRSTSNQFIQQANPEKEQLKIQIKHQTTNKEKILQ